ncbi:endolytic transglycosylase MltG [Aerococcaceae bacterium NML210727]|nr:endolytic transglycosylase MltG [Aerococcaceae bacterium NML210727]MCW6655412.1 endolytic transglycosylase MltG [Aerococcaceae bacterium NML201296]MCW6675153.1 endolytic transglycosylase MltG [Aerococcaceae bacterium NML171108]
MKKLEWKKIREQARESETYHVKETLWTNRIVKYIIIGLFIFLLVTGVGGYLYVRHALGPVDANNQNKVAVTIPIGSSNREIATILKEHGIIHHVDLFNFYLKSKSVSGLQAGHYELSPAMTAEEVIIALEKGGTPIAVDVDTKLTVIEGMTLEQIAEMVANNTPFTKEEFMATVNDEAFVKHLTTQFPSLLNGLMEIEGLKYRLEGYLFPATYDYFAGTDVKEIITQMVAKTNLEYHKLKDNGDLNDTWMSFHQVLTLASIVEKEGITDEDRKLIAGVFLNRINAEMPLQSDITVLYALGVHKELVTYEDLEVDSPYNLYKHHGLGPGPYDSPSLNAILAVLHPTYSDYYYFVADLETQKIYYSATIEEHDALVAQYVNKESSSTQEVSSEATDESEETE